MVEVTEPGPECVVFLLPSLTFRRQRRDPTV